MEPISITIEKARYPARPLRGSVARWGLVALLFVAVPGDGYQVVRDARGQAGCGEQAGDETMKSVGRDAVQGLDQMDDVSLASVPAANDQAEIEPGNERALQGLDQTDDASPASVPAANDQAEIEPGNERALLELQRFRAIVAACSRRLNVFQAWVSETAWLQKEAVDLVGPNPRPACEVDLAVYFQACMRPRPGLVVVIPASACADLSDLPKVLERVTADAEDQRQVRHNACQVIALNWHICARHARAQPEPEAASPIY